jgi:hypothetical protein
VFSTKYFQGNKIKEDEVSGALSMHGMMRYTYRILIRKLEWRSQLEKPKNRWEYNIKIDLIFFEFGVLDWIHLAHDRVQ